ncbi:MAG: hypothetical protein K5669_02470 [Lachnospiraceae bacterium]|nr:hypothetical protein [Lachnospiraceae bacterium]
MKRNNAGSSISIIKYGRMVVKSADIINIDIKALFVFLFEYSKERT